MKQWVVVCAVIGAIAVMGGGAQADQPANPSFEEGTLWQAPTSWTGYGSHPLITSNTSLPWGFDNPPGGARTGTRWAGQQAGWEAKNGGLYQVVNVNPGTSGTARVYIAGRASAAGAQGRIGIDRTGGTNPNSANIQWSSFVYADNYTLAETPNVTATGGVVTVFLNYTFPYAYEKQTIYFEDVSLTGTLANPAQAGTPPQVSNLTLTSPPNIGNLNYSYTLTDADGAGTANIEVDYQVGRVLDFLFLPESELVMGNLGANGTGGPSAPDGNGTGRGNWRVKGNETGDWRNGTAGATYIRYKTFDNWTGELMFSVKISDWERTGTPFRNHGDWEGAGIFMATPDLSQWYAVDALDQPGFDNAIYVAANVNCGGNSGRLIGPYNLEGTGVPTDGNNPFYFRLERLSDRVRCGFSRTGQSRDDYVFFHEFLNPDAGVIARGNPIIIGMYVNMWPTINFESILLDWTTATSGPGGDGKTNLSTSPAGVPHVFQWAAGTDLMGLTSLTAARLRIRATDINGSGAWGSSVFSALSPGGACQSDIDGDGKCDTDEADNNNIGPTQTSMILPDSDGDGRNDAVDAAPRNKDADGDRFIDGLDANPASPNAGYTDADNDELHDAQDPNPANADSDADRYKDGYEAAMLGAGAVTNANQKPGLGDVNFDNFVTSLDALIVQSLFLNIINPSAAVFHPGGVVVGGYINSDVNRDGYVTSLDALIIQSFFLQILGNLPL